MTCEHLNGTYCQVATQLCGMSCETTNESCNACMSQSRPKQENIVTLGLSVVAIRQNGKQLSNFPEIHKAIRSSLPSSRGPGTELKKLISWFYVPDDSSCKCNDRIAKMNKWGPDGCEERMDTIIRWLKHSAATHNVPFQETVVRMLIKRAISNARKAV